MRIHLGHPYIERPLESTIPAHCASSVGDITASAAEMPPRATRMTCPSFGKGSCGYHSIRARKVR
jgi:hypothetical protein